MARWLNRFQWLALLPLLASGPALHAQPNWRVFDQDTDGLAARNCTYLSLGPSGHLWIRHGDEPFLSRFNGYEVQRVPAPNPGPLPAATSFRIYEGGTGQFWTLHTNGVQWFDGQIWRVGVIPEVRAELQSQALRAVRGIPLLPVEHNHVLVLLSDRLIKFDALSTRTNLIKESAAVGLGRFGDLLPAAEGGFWITAEGGVARVKPATRVPDAPLTNEFEWQTHRIPAGLNAHNPQRPFEDSQGGLLMLADAREGTGQVWLRLHDGEWTTERLPARLRQMRQAWRTRDGKAWGLDAKALVQWLPPEAETREMSDIGIKPGMISEAIGEPNGAFWISTPDGVWRYAPAGWTSPDGWPLENEAVPEIHEAADGLLWFLGERHLVSYAARQWKSYPLPARPEGTNYVTSPLGEFADRRLFFSDGEGLVVFDPGRGEFQRLPRPVGLRVRYLGSQTNAHFFAEHAPGNPAQRLMQFDGRDWLTPAIAQPPDGIGEWTTLMVTSGGEWWLGGSQGAARFTANGWSAYSVANQGIPDGVTTLLERDAKTIWAGSRAGLLMFNGQKWEIAPVTLSRVNRLSQTRDGTAWAATDSGLQRWFQGQWIAMGAEEGVANDAQVLHETRDRQLWLGHSRGVSRFHREADAEPPQTYLVDPPNSEMISGTGTLTFSFTGKDRWRATATDRLYYMCRIDEGPWRSPTPVTRFAITANELPVGEHVFEVRALDRSLNLDPTPVKWSFTVVLPWYLEPRLAGIVILAALAVLVFAGLAINRHLRLVRSYAEIERIVAERTHQLEVANRALAHSEKMRSLGTLAAGVAHDFNSILSIIRGSAQIIEANPDNQEKVMTRVSRIKSMVEQGSTLVKAMLGFSRADDAALVLESVGTVVADTVRLLSDRLPPDVIVTVDAGAKLPPVHGTRELLQQMLVNLVLNAVDAMDGKGRLNLKCQPADGAPEQCILPPAKAGEYVAVSVEDTGCGIAPENLTRIFEPFFTTKAFSTRHGTGLGLSMVYEFSKELGYGLNVRSVLKQGSVFTIVIPVFEEPDGPSTPTQAAG